MIMVMMLDMLGVLLLVTMPLTRMIMVMMLDMLEVLLLVTMPL